MFLTLRKFFVFSPRRRISSSRNYSTASSSSTARTKHEHIHTRRNDHTTHDKVASVVEHCCYIRLLNLNRFDLIRFDLLEDEWLWATLCLSVQSP